MKKVDSGELRVENRLGAFFRKLVDRISGRAANRELIERFMRVFPAKCLICSYHRFGLRERLTRELHPEAHDCIEGGYQPSTLNSQLPL